MKFRFLGTAASEGFPAVFCDCEFCREARKRKGKNYRTRLQSIVNDDLLIDLPPDTYMHVLNFGLELFKVKYLLLTHSHSDHFCPEELSMRGYWFAPPLKDKIIIFGTEQVYDKYVKYTTAMQQPVREMIEFKVIKPFDQIEIGDYRIVALPARHGTTDGVIYQISEGGKNVLYAHDTGYLFDSVLEYIKREKIRYDMISLDCTNIEIPIPDDCTHMGLENIGRLVEVLKDYGAVDKDTVLYINHFSHNANPLHEELCERAEKLGLQVAFDGLEINV